MRPPSWPRTPMPVGDVKRFRETLIALLRQLGVDERNLACTRRIMAGDYDPTKFTAGQMRTLEEGFGLYDQIVCQLLRGEDLLH